MRRPTTAPSCFELVGDLEGDDPTEAVSAEKVRTVGLHLPDLGHVAGRHRRDVVERRLSAVEAEGLDADDRDPGSDAQGQVPIDEDLARVLVHDEEDRTVALPQGGEYGRIRFARVRSAVRRT